jgi:large subunit ribosomal protein L4
MQLDIYNIKGEKTGRSVSMPDEIFAAEPNQHVVYLAVKQYLAAQRQGTHKVKTRAEVKGSSKKLHKQKGTGGSRKGNIRNPLYKGGGTIFGPKPHKYTIKLNRKVKDLAKVSALSQKVKDNALMIIEDVNMAAPKTSEFVSILKGFNATEKKVLFILPEYNETLHLSTRNLGNVLTNCLNDINTYDIMNSNVLLMTEGAANIFSESTVEAPAEA